MTSAALVLEELNRCCVTHVVGLPDNSSGLFFSLLDRQADIRRVGVTREGEAFALASGLWIGGRRPAVLIQNTGLLESGDGYRGTALRMRIPLLCLITCRGYARLERSGIDRDPGSWHADLLSRPDLDSVALFTEPTLRSWGLPFDFLRGDADIAKISLAQERADRESRPVALLLSGDFS
ncbi:MAG: hypothetical protein FJW35_03720 [Acidobacteria bacterium]|nr:hypothetical protein [Acidobacteriota bacterium]